jgi:hypothetical protein
MLYWILNFSKYHFTPGICLFIAAWANFQLSDGCHHYQWQSCKFMPMPGAYVFKQWDFIYVPHLLRHRISVFKVISERSVILTSVCRAVDSERASPEALSLWLNLDQVFEGFLIAKTVRESKTLIDWQNRISSVFLKHGWTLTGIASQIRILEWSNFSNKTKARG